GGDAVLDLAVGDVKGLRSGRIQYVRHARREGLPHGHLRCGHEPVDLQLQHYGHQQRLRHHLRFAGDRFANRWPDADAVHAVVAGRRAVAHVQWDIHDHAGTSRPEPAVEHRCGRGSGIARGTRILTRTVPTTCQPVKYDAALTVTKSCESKVEALNNQVV